MTLSRALGYAAGAALALAVTACGGDSGSPAASGSPSSPAATSSSPADTATTPPSAKTPTTPPPASDTPAGRTIEVTITGKKVTPAPATIDLEVGEKLTLVVTSDHDDTIHAHGFEVEGELKAGTPSTVTITGTDPGLFEVETHEPPLRLMMVAVR
jgi:plastocyanin